MAVTIPAGATEPAIITITTKHEWEREVAPGQRARGNRMGVGLKALATANSWILFGRVRPKLRNGLSYLNSEREEVSAKRVSGFSLILIPPSSDPKPSRRRLKNQIVIPGKSADSDPVESNSMGYGNFGPGGLDDGSGAFGCHGR